MSNIVLILKIGYINNVAVENMLLLKYKMLYKCYKCTFWASAG